MEKKINEMTPDEIWAVYLNEGAPGLRKRAQGYQRLLMGMESGLLKNIPSSPRCMWCYAPFRGIGAPFMQAVGKGQSNLNPNLCMDCENFIQKNHGGAEVDLTMLFADIRGSTKLAEAISPSDFRGIINRFYRVTTDVLIRQDALIDKLIGDEVAAFFVPGLAGNDHPYRAVEAAKQVLEVTGHLDRGGPWAPVGIGLHSGTAFVGIVGDAEKLSDITVLGDVANTASRLASAAQAGEIVMSAETVKRSGIDISDLMSLDLELKGKSDTFAAWKFTAAVHRTSAK